MKKIMSIAICLLLVLSTVVCFTGCGEIVTSEFGAELVTNGSFENGLENWETVVSSQTSTVNVREHSQGSDEYVNHGAKYISLHNAKAGYALVKQKIQIEPGATYRVEAVINITKAITTGGSTTYEGAYIGFEENIKFVISDKTKATNGFTKYTYYFTTDDFREVTISAHLGVEGATSVGTAWIDSVSMVKVDPSAPNMVGVKIQDLGIYVPDNGGVPGILYLTLGSVLVLLISYFIYVAIRRHGYLNQTDREKRSAIVRFFQKNWAILAVLAFALIIRVVLGHIYSGYKTDMNLWANAADRLHNVGLDGYYTAGSRIMPLYAYVLWGIGAIMRGAGVVGSGLFLLVKIPAIICDLVAVFFIYKLGKKFIGQVGGILGALLYAIIPTVLTITSVWGAMDSVFALFVLLTFYFILNPNDLSNGKRFTGVFVFLVLGLLTKYEMIWLIPIIATFLIWNFIKKKDTRKSIIIGTLLSIVAFYVVTIPFFIDYIGRGRIFYVWEYYYSAIAKGTHYYAMDNFGLYALVGLNWKAVTSLSSIMNLAFGILLIAFTLLIYFKNKSRLEIILLAALTLLGASTFAIDMTPTFMLTGLALLLTYAIIANEKRAYILFVGYALLGFLNAALVLNASASLTPFVIGSVVKLASGNAWLIIMSVLEIAALCYFVYLAYDLCVNDKLQQIDYIEGKDTATVWGRLVYRFKRK